MALTAGGYTATVVSPHLRLRFGAQRDVRSATIAQCSRSDEQNGLFLGRIKEEMETTLVQEELRGTSPSFATFVGTSSGAWGGVSGAWNPISGASEGVTVLPVVDETSPPPAAVSSKAPNSEGERPDTAVRYRPVKDSRVFTVDSAESSSSDSIVLKRIEYYRGTVKNLEDLTAGGDVKDLRIKGKTEFQRGEPGFVHFEDGCASRGPLVLSDEAAAVIEGTLIDNGQRVRISLVLDFSELEYGDLLSSEDGVHVDEESRHVSGSGFLPSQNETDSVRYSNGVGGEMDAVDEPSSCDSVMNILQCTMSCEEWKGPSLLWTSPGFQDSSLAVLSKCERTPVSSLLGFWKVFEQKASNVEGNFVYSQQEFSARKTLSLKEKEEGGYWLITLPYGVTAAIETDIEANVLRIRMGWFSQYLTRKNDKKITGDLGDVRSEIVRTYDVDSGVLLNVTLRNEIRGDWKGGRM